MLASLIQQIAAGAAVVFTGTSSNGTGTHSSTTAPVTDVSSLIAFLFSFSALRDWLKLLLIGGTLEILRRIVTSSYSKLIDSFWVTAYFDEDDSSYSWMMVWLSKQPNWSNARHIEVSTRAFDGRDGVAILVPGEEDDAATAISGSRKLAYLPSVMSSYHFWYKRRLVLISRVKTDGGYYGKKQETLHVSIMSRSHGVLNDMLLEAKKQYIADQSNTISIYVSDSRNEWRHAATRPKRPLRSIVLDPGIKDLLVDDAREFLESKKWYTERGIPFRRGYLLYGAPGSGKTSIIHSLASELGLDIYIISLSRVGLDDTSLGELISDLPEKCIALMEDIDAAFHQGLNRDDFPDDPKPEETPVTPGSPRRSPPRTASRISLSGLLNALDGIGAQEGRLLYATTNRFSALDSALIRPGRMDLHVEFKLASRYQARELYRAFYRPPSDDEGAREVESEKDLGEISESSTVVDDPDATLVEEEKSLLNPGPTATKSHRFRVPQVPRAQLADLARQFGEALPEREFSMASLQGYLMTYKTRPFEAVANLEAWIEKERAERLEKAKASVEKPPLVVLSEPSAWKK